MSDSFSDIKYFFLAKNFSDKTVTSIHLKMDEKEDDDIVITESAEADINVDVQWSWKISLRSAPSMNFLMHLEWRVDTLIVIKYPCSKNPGKSPKVSIF